MTLPGRVAHYLAAALLLASCDAEPFGGRVYPAATSFPPPQTDRCVDGLTKRHVTVPLGAGIRSDVDPKLLPLDYTAELLNSRVGRRGEVVKRTGLDFLSTGLLGTTDTLPLPAWSLGTLGGCLASLSGAGLDHPLNMFSPNAGQWATDTANGLTATERRGPITARRARAAAVGLYPAVAYSGGYYFVTFVELTATAAAPIVHQVALDFNTGKRAFERTVLPGVQVFNLGVKTVNGYAVFLHDTTGADLAFDTWQISNLDAGPTTTTFSTTTAGAFASGDFLVKDSTTLTFAYLDSTLRIRGVDFVPSAGTTAGWTLLDSASATVTGDYAFSWMQDFGASGKIALQAASSTQGLRVFWDIPTTGGTRQAVSTYVMDAAPLVVNSVTGHTRGNSATGEFTVLYDNDNTNTIALIKAAKRLAGAIVSGGIYYRGMALRSKTFTSGGDYYVLGEYPSLAQGTRFVLRVNDAAAGQVAKVQVGNGVSGVSISDHQLADVVSTSTGHFATAATAQVRAQPARGVAAPIDFSLIGLDLINVDFSTLPDTTLGTPREAIGSLFVPGGVLGRFDGSTYAEAGFAWYPEQPLLTPNAPGANTYYYKLTYELADGSGALWESADSIMISTTTAAAIGAGGSVTVAAPTLRLASGRRVTIGVYRGRVGDSTTFQRIGSVANNINVDTVSFVDTVSDVVQATGTFLYTNGGVLANDAIPGFAAIAIAGNRLYGISADEPDVIWVSNLFVPRQGLRFAEQNKIGIRDQHGTIYAIAAQPNGNVVALKGDATYVISGDGPDAAGRGGFTVTLISTDTGTTNPRSVLETSDGVEFQSTGTRRGFFRVTTGLTVEYIGGPVEAYVGETITAAVLVTSRSEVHYYTATQKALVRDLMTGVWSVDTLAYDVVSAVAYGTGVALGTPDGVLVDSVAYADAGGNDYEHAAATGWLKLADLHGYQRFYRIQGVGERVGTHDLQVSLYRDFDDTTPFYTATVTPGALWDWEMRYSKKLAALKVRLSYTSSNAGARMTAIVVEYGVKQGMRPGPASKRTA